MRIGAHITLLFGIAAFMGCETCAPQLEPACEIKEPLAESQAELQRIALFRDADTALVTLSSFNHAAPPGSKIIIQNVLSTTGDDAESQTFAETIADEDGRFSMTANITGPLASLLFQFPDGRSEQWPFQVREEDSAFACLIRTVSNTGTLPNDVIFGTCDTDRVGLVVASADSTLEHFSLSGEKQTDNTAYFPPIDQRAPNPYNAAWDSELGLVGVTLFGTNSIALIDPCTGDYLHQARPTPGSHSDLLMAVDPPLELAYPSDVNGDGELEQTVHHILPTAPQGLIWNQGILWVLFSGFLEGATENADALFGPGALIGYSWSGTELTLEHFRRLPFSNPQTIVQSHTGELWISYTGIWGISNGQFQTLTPGYLEKVSADDGTGLHVIELGSFAPGAPAVGEHAIAVGSTLKPEIAWIPISANSMEEARIFELAGTETESLFKAHLWGPDLAWVTQFSTDQIHVVDLNTGFLNPAPFPEDGIRISGGGSLFRGAQALAIDQDKHQGDMGIVLLGLSAEIAFLDFRQVFGP
jgi:hypothetical protein